MGRLVVVEGLDGSGKQTLTRRLVDDLRARGRSVATLAFPRYGASVYADLCRDLLHGRLGDLTDSVHGSALVFALDRRDAAEQIRALLREHDVVLLDRYVSSNAAYGTARLGATAAGEFADWVEQLEIGRFAVPRPDLQILLNTSVAMSADRMAGRAADAADRALDRFEADTALQRRTSAVYGALAAVGYLSPWRVLTPGPDGATELPDVLG